MNVGLWLRFTWRSKRIKSFLCCLSNVKQGIINDAHKCYVHQGARETHFTNIGLYVYDKNPCALAY